MPDTASRRAVAQHRSSLVCRRVFSIDLWDLAHTFLLGHRIRLEISSSNFPRFDRNLNTGNEIGRDGPEDALTATQQVFHDAERASALILPIAIQAEEG